MKLLSSSCNKRHQFLDQFHPGQSRAAHLHQLLPVLKQSKGFFIYLSRLSSFSFLLSTVLMGVNYKYFCYGLHYLWSCTILNLPSSFCSTKYKFRFQFGPGHLRWKLPHQQPSVLKQGLDLCQTKNCSTVRAKRPRDISLGSQDPDMTLSSWVKTDTGWVAQVVEDSEETRLPKVTKASFIQSLQQAASTKFF